MSGLARSAVAEALATFLFVFIIIAAVNNVGDLTPLVIGFALMTLVFATGHLSGAHLNPAVSLGIFLRGALSVGTSKDHLNNSFYGLALGTTVFIGAATVGGISGVASTRLWPLAWRSAVSSPGPTCGCTCSHRS